MEGVPRPAPAWMSKPRSEKDTSNFFRGIGKNDWNKRYVFIDGTTICYGKGVNKKDKVLHFETIRSAEKIETADFQKEPGVPPDLIECGWALKLADKDVKWACENPGVAREWVDYVNTVLDVMKGKKRIPDADDDVDLDALLEDDGQENAFGNDDDDDDPLDKTMTMTQQAAMMQQKLQDQSSSANRIPPAQSSRRLAPEGDDDEDGEGGAKTQRELQRLAGGDADDDDDINLDDLGDLDDMDFSEEDEDGADGEGGPNERFVESQAETYARILEPISEKRHNHIAFKLEGYKEHFAKGDGPDKVRFSRSVTKVAKQDNSQDRDVIITDTHVYLVKPGRFKTSVRAIPVDQVVGIVESTEEDSLFAMIIPSFHDVLLLITAQNSLVGGSEVEVKQQFIAHLHAANRQRVQGRQFIFREAADIRKVIRRCSDDKHLPLDESADRMDRLKVATKKSLYETFRTNAESIVYYSGMVLRVNPNKEQHPKGFVVTDAACYLISSSMDKISRRIPLGDIHRLFYDSNMRGILAKCAEYDFMIIVKAPGEFDIIRNVIISTAALSGKTIKAQASNQLYSNAQLVEVKRLMDVVGGGLSSTEEGLKKGWRMTQRLMRNMGRGTLKATKGLGEGIKSLGADTADLLGSAAKGMTSAMVDNALTGEMLGVLGAVAGAERVVHEMYFTFEEEKKQMRLAVDANDAMRIGQSPAAQSLKLGKIYHSSRCQRYNLISHVDVDKTQDRIVIICDRGVLICEDPTQNGSGGVMRLLRSKKELEIDEKASWRHIRGLVRCERNLLGIMLGEEKSTDMMLRIPNAVQTDRLVAHLCDQFHKLSSTADCDLLLPTYSVDSREQLRVVLKKTTFDQAPTIALRRSTSDSMRLAVQPDIADTCRRHGDNAVLFSGLAWRFRGKTTKQAGKMEEYLDKYEDHREDKKNFKSFILLLTNCAVYQLTKGNNEIVRRIELQAISKVYTSTEDPDAILLMIRGDDEFDMLFRVEGRAKEFMDRLQTAVLEWTSFALYFPHEEPSSHRIEDFFPQTDRVNNLLRESTRLVKPQGYNDLQANRQATDVHRQYLTYFKKRLTEACRDSHETLKNLDYKVDNVDMMSDKYSEGGSMMPKRFPFSRYKTQMESALCVVRFELDRAYRFGCRAQVLPAMADGNKLVHGWEKAVAMANRLEDALEAEQIDNYESLQVEADALGFGLGLLLEEQALRHRSLKERHRIVREIKRYLALDSNPTDPDEEPKYLEDHLGDLEKLFKKAERLQVRAETVAKLRVEVDKKLQSERIALYLTAKAAKPGTSMDATTKEVLLEAANRLGVDDSLQEQLKSTTETDQATAWATRTLQWATKHGKENGLQEAIERVEQALPDGTRNSIVTKELEAAKQQLTTLHAAEPLRNQLADLIMQAKGQLENMDLPELQALRPQFVAVSQQSGHQPSLQPTHALSEMYIKRIDVAIHHREVEARALEKIRSQREEVRERIRAKEVEEQKLRELAEEAEREANRRRREDQLTLWVQRVSKLAYSTKQYVATKDVAATGQIIRSCTALLDEIRVSFAQFPAPERVALQQTFDQCESQLKSSLALGRGLLDEHGKKSDDDARIPSDVEEMIREQEKAKLVAYIKTNQQRLSVASIAAIRSKWETLAKERAWVVQLHSSLHTAVALKNITLLQTHLESAKAKGYMDPVVADAAEIMRVMAAEEAKAREERGEAPEDEGENDGSKAEDEDAAASAPLPLISIPELLQEYRIDAGTRGQVIGSLITSMSAVFNDTQRNEAVPDEPAMLKVPEDSEPVRDLVYAWIKVLQHRAKPSGFIKKVERNMLDVLHHIANLQSKGSFLAPYVNFLVNDFERIKKFNSPKGHSSQYVLMQFILTKGSDLRLVINEITKLPPKEIENLFFDDSVFRNSNCREDLLTLCGTLTSIQWGFTIQDRASVDIAGVSNSRSGNAVAARGAVAAEAEKPTGPNAHLVGPDGCVVKLRRAVTAISTYFADELKRLGSRPAPEDVRRIFDETKCKAAGLLVRESLCRALHSVLLAGFKPTHFLSKRHPWQLINEAGERLRESARDLGGAAMPMTVDMVMQITDKEGKDRSALARLSEEQLFDIRLRMFLCHALNSHSLAAYFESLFDLSPVHQKLLDKYYHLDKCPMVCNEEARKEIMRVIGMVSKMPFVLIVDAEVW